MVCIQAGEELTRETWMEEEDSFCPQVGYQGRQEGVATFQMNRWSKKLLGQVSQQLENWGKIELKFLKLDLQCITLWELNFESCYIHNSPSPQKYKEHGRLADIYNKELQITTTHYKSAAVCLHLTYQFYDTYSSDNCSAVDILPLLQPWIIQGILCT